MMEIIPNTGKVLVKAADPLAKQGIPLYYTHSKTNLYNDIFFHFWDTVMTPSLCNICPLVETCQSTAVFGRCSTKNNCKHPSLALALQARRYEDAVFV
jgi:hypothetical protein